MKIRTLKLFPLILAASAVSANSQEPKPTATVIAVPVLATSKVTETDAGSTWGLANQIADSALEVRQVRLLSMAPISAIPARSHPSSEGFD